MKNLSQKLRENHKQTAVVGAIVFLFVGGVLQGIGANIQRYASPDVAWGGLGVLVGGGISVWFARRLRWWLLLYIPAIIMLMVPIATAAEVYTANLVSRTILESGKCGGWEDLDADLDPVSASIATYSADLNSTEDAEDDSLRRWADNAAAIRQQYEGLDIPPVLIRYRELSAEGMRQHEQGFDALARGDDEDAAIALLDQGDRTLVEARAAFRDAAAECQR